MMSAHASDVAALCVALLLVGAVVVSALRNRAAARQDAAGRPAREPAIDADPYRAWKGDDS